MNAQQGKSQTPAWPVFVVPIVAAIFVGVFTMVRVAAIFLSAAIRIGVRAIVYLMGRVFSRRVQRESVSVRG